MLEHILSCCSITSTTRWRAISTNKGVQSGFILDSTSLSTSVTSSLIYPLKDFPDIDPARSSTQLHANVKLHIRDEAFSSIKTQLCLNSFFNVATFLNLSCGYEPANVTVMQRIDEMRGLVRLARVCVCVHTSVAVCPCHNLFVSVTSWCSDSILFAACETSEIMFLVPPARGLRVGAGHGAWE